MKCSAQTKAPFHLSELTGQHIPIVMRISLLIKTNHLDQSNPKYYAQKEMVFQQNLLEKAYFIVKMSGGPWSGSPVLTFGKSPKTEGLLPVAYVY